MMEETYRFWEKVKINGKEIDMLVDTGAGSSIIRPETAEMLGLTTEWEGELKHNVGATFSSKKVRVEMELSGCKAETTLHIADVQNDLIGADFLRHIEAMIDMKEKKIIPHYCP